MHRVLVVIAFGGCVTTASVVRGDRVTLPVLVGAVAADLVVSSLAFRALDLSTSGAIASGIAFSAVDLGIGCVLGACTVLRP